MQHRQEVREKNCCSENFLSNELSYLNWDAFLPFGQLFFCSVFSTNTAQIQAASAIVVCVIPLLIKHTTLRGCFFSDSSFSLSLIPTSLANLSKKNYATKVTFTANHIC
jgi:hypothetical protein